MEDAKYIELAAKYLSGDIDSTERRELMEWVAESDANQAFFDEMIHLWGLTGDADKAFDADTGPAWDKVAARINQGQAQPPVVEVPKTGDPGGRIIPLSINRRLLQIAAILLPILLLGGWWLLQPKADQDRLIVSTQDTEVISLPDGSRIWLNKNSSLHFQEDFKERRVELVGEAYFEIARDTTRPFEIYSGETITRVLGTSFNIRAYPDEEKVQLTVTTGLVEFEEKEDREDKILVPAGEAAVYLRQEKTVQSVSSLGSNALAWKNRSIQADNIPLGDFLQTLSNYFDRKIVADDPAALNCATFLPEVERPELDSVLSIVAGMMSMTVDSSGSEIVLLGSACNEGN